MHVGINAQLLASTSDYRQAGLSRYIYELLAHLPGAEPDLRLTAFVGRGQLPDTLRSPDLEVRVTGLPTLNPVVRIAWEQAALPFAVRRSRLDLLHCPVNVRPLASPAPAVITVHDLVFLRYPQSFRPFKRSYLTVMTRWSARHAAHAIAVSESTRSDVIRLLRVPAHRVTCVYNGVASHFRPLPEEALQRFRAENALAGRIVLCVGTLEPRKNLVVLLQAFRALAEDPQFADVTLAIGGSKGWYYQEVFATAERLGLTSSGRVRFLGRVPDEDLPLWYNVAAVFAYPSKYEGFGLPVLEAMACGAPVIASNTSSFPEIAGGAATLVDPEDVGAWSEAMRRLLGSPELARRCREAGLTQARRFDWRRTARETAQVYRRTLGLESAGGGKPQL